MVKKNIELEYEIKWEKEEEAKCVSMPQSPINIDGFTLSFDGNVLHAFTEGDDPTIEDARAVLEPKLRDWEVAGLRNGLRYRFVLSFGHIRSGWGKNLREGVTIYVPCTNINVTAQPRVQEFPNPRISIRDAKIISDVFKPFHELQDGQRKLCDAGYLTVTLLQDHYGEDRLKGALNISGHVIKKLKRLSSQNDSEERRKVTTSQGQIKAAEKPFKQHEKDWMVRAIQKIAERVFDVETGNKPENLPKITKQL